MEYHRGAVPFQLHRGSQQFPAEGRHGGNHALSPEQEFAPPADERVVRSFRCSPRWRHHVIESVFTVCPRADSRIFCVSFIILEKFPSILSKESITQDIFAVRQRLNRVFQFRLQDIIGNGKGPLIYFFTAFDIFHDDTELVLPALQTGIFHLHDQSLIRDIRPYTR